MLALNIPELKNFMNQLLCSDTFDHFLLKEATIQKDAVWNFDGTVTPDFYSSEELEEQGLSGLAFLPYGRVRQHCFDLIKGNGHLLILSLFFCSHRTIYPARLPVCRRLLHHRM